MRKEREEEEKEGDLYGVKWKAAAASPPCPAGGDYAFVLGCRQAGRVTASQS